MSARSDRRRRVRFEVIGQLWGTLEIEEPAPVVDIGSNGALLSTAVPLAPDSKHSLQVPVRGDAVAVDARVRHVRAEPSTPPRYLVGVEFLNLPAVIASSLEHDDPGT